MGTTHPPTEGQNPRKLESSEIILIWLHNIFSVLGISSTGISSCICTLSVSRYDMDIAVLHSHSVLHSLFSCKIVWCYKWLVMSSCHRWFMRVQMLCCSLLPHMRRIRALSPVGPPTQLARWRHLPNLSSKVRNNESFVDLTLLL